MNSIELFHLCVQRQELDFLFNITKAIAESDSIGESHGYCSNYTRESFNEEINGLLQDGDKSYTLMYVYHGALPVYHHYINHVSKQL